MMLEFSQLFFALSVIIRILKSANILISCWQVPKVMAAFSTGQKAPSSATYDFAGHMNGDTTCQPSDHDKKMPLSKGDMFPACTKCNSSVYWTNGN
jgi:hypothetical protein